MASVTGIIKEVDLNNGFTADFWSISGIGLDVFNSKVIISFSLYKDAENYLLKRHVTTIIPRLIEISFSDLGLFSPMEAPIQEMTSQIFQVALNDNYFSGCSTQTVEV